MVPWQWDCLKILKATKPEAMGKVWALDIAHAPNLATVPKAEANGGGGCMSLEVLYKYISSSVTGEEDHSARRAEEGGRSR